MALQAVGTSNFLSASLGNNPIQTLGMLSITMLAVNTLSNLPMAKADEGGFPWREYCEVQCTPITGEKTVTHQICVETCLVGKEMIKTTTEQALKNGKWEVVKQLGKVVTAIKPIGDGIDCYSICNNPLQLVVGWLEIYSWLAIVYGAKIYLMLVVTVKVLLLKQGVLLF